MKVDDVWRKIHASDMPLLVFTNGRGLHEVAAANEDVPSGYTFVGAYDSRCKKQWLYNDVRKVVEGEV